MAHKLRHGLSQDPSRPLHGFLEADETDRGEVILSACAPSNAALSRPIK
jgi:hypothetical protein